MNRLLTAFILSLSAVFTSFAQTEAEVTADIATDSLAVDTLSLGEIVVKASNIRHDGLKDSYTVTTQMRRGKKRAGELLTNLNGIHYNPLTREVKYLGSTNIIILIDSVPKDADYIKTLSPGRFDRIDIVNHPSGQYQGYDALINFHTYPDYVGWEINTEGGLGIVPDDSNGEGKHINKGHANVYITYTRNKLTFSLTPSVATGDNGESYFYERRYPLNDGAIKRTVERPLSDPSNRSKAVFFNNGISLDYKINDRHSVSAMYNLFISRKDDTVRQTLIMSNDNSPAEEAVEYRSKDKTYDNYNHMFGLYYRGVTGAWNINAYLTYNLSMFNSLRRVDRSDGYELLDEKRNDRRYTWGGFDLTRSFGENGQWRTGLSENINVISTKESRLHTGLMLSDNSIIDNRVYLNLGFNPSNSFSIYLYAGLSVYHNEWDSESKTDITPAIQAYATFRPSDKFMARLSYQSTSSLPPMSTLSGYGSFVDSLSYQAGNPALSGSWKNYVELLLSFINRINLKAAFSNTTDAIFDIAGVGYGQDHPYVYYKYQNGISRYWKIIADYNQPLPRGFMIAVSGSVTGGSAIYKDLRRSKWLPDADVTLTYRHEKSNFMAMFQYGVMNTLRNLTPQGRSYDIFDGFCFGAEKYFLKGRLSVNFTYILPLHLFRGKAHGRFDSPALVQRSWNDNYKRLDNKIQVGVTYRFSNGQRVRTYNHNMYTLQ